MTKRAKKAIALDTNFFGKGLPDVGKLRQWVRDARAAGFEIWIPEVVLWELAAHVWDIIQETNASIARLGGILAKAALPQVTPVSFASLEELLDALDDAFIDLGDGLEIIGCKPEDAIEGLKDQIFARGTGEKKGGKGGIRTGAADSAWIRSVLRVSDEGGNELVIVSNDPDVSRALESEGRNDVVVFRTTDDARAALFPYGLAPLELTYDVLSHVQQALKAGGHPAWGGSFPSDVSMIIQDSWLRDTEQRVVAATITEFDRIVSAEPLSLSSDRNRGSIEINVEAACELSTVPIEGSFTEPMAVPVTFPHWVFHYNLWVELRDGVVEDFGVNDDPWAMHYPAVWEDWEEALDECLGSYFDVPEHAGEELAHGGVGKWSVPLHRYSGEDVTLNANVTESGWKIEAEAAGGTLLLTCQHGRRRGTWRVEVEEDGGTIGERPKYAISAFLIRLGIKDRRDLLAR